MAKFSKFIVAAAASLALGAAQADVVIDLFNGTQVTGDSLIGDVPSTGAMQYAKEYSDVTVIGGSRDLGVQKTSSNDDGLAGTKAFVNGGKLSWSVDALTQARAVVRWDGDQSHAAGINTAGTVTPQGGISNQFASSGLVFNNLLGLNLGLNDNFQFDVIKSDLGFTFWLELYDIFGNSSKIKFESQAHLASVSTPIPVAAFVGICGIPGGEFADPADGDGDDVIAGACSSAAFDVTKLGAIQFIIETINDGSSDSAVDLAISAVRVVPEPGALALVGLGLLGAAGAGARRRRTV